MTGIGIFPGDLAVINRARRLVDKSIVLALVDGDQQEPLRPDVDRPLERGLPAGARLSRERRPSRAATRLRCCIVVLTNVVPPHEAGREPGRGAERAHECRMCAVCFNCAK